MDKEVAVDIVESSHRLQHFVLEGVPAALAMRHCGYGKAEVTESNVVPGRGYGGTYRGYGIIVAPSEPDAAKAVRTPR